MSGLKEKVRWKTKVEMSSGVKTEKVFTYEELSEGLLKDREKGTTIAGYLIDDRLQTANDIVGRVTVERVKI